MLSAAAFASTAVLLAASIPSTDAHGYMLIPESQFKGSANSAWIVQIDPVWASEDWDGNKPGSVDAFKALKTANKFKDLKTLMDDTSVYGADCGFTDPNGKAQPIPKDGKATFSRALVHVGPCEIWLDDTKVLYEDDCFSKYGNENQDIKSVFLWITPRATVVARRCVSTGWHSRAWTARLCGSPTRIAFPSRVPEGAALRSRLRLHQLVSPILRRAAIPRLVANLIARQAANLTAHPAVARTPRRVATLLLRPRHRVTLESGIGAGDPSAETPEVSPAPSSKCNGRKRRN
ncbi:hypothetical protein GN244_ATG18892 [Phytophthora infestans]|uniref:Uncharacterized protein n=1 Tax=Phytophthora infestans TaxID=4787 RepID=A0A833W4G9_PHYIN|nr:hypothetical protein GN244_ATG18892 [Phytophthora infestans]